MITIEVLNSDMKISTMKSGKNFKISLEEMSSKGKMIIAQQSEISFAKALAQIQLLKENSKVAQSAKKNRLAS